MTTTPPISLNARQRMLLTLLDALGSRVGNLDFQKLLFLRCQEEGASAPYDFVPYMFGAFSFTSYADRRKLVERGLLADDGHHWELSPHGKGALKGALSTTSAMSAFVRKHRELRGDALVAETYRRFPYYATKSTIANRVLHGDKAALTKIESARPAPRQAGITTIGYEGHTLERYLNQLISNGVTVLCDVRRNAISRKYGFSKGTLSKACEGVGLRYEHLPDLGVASEKRQSLDTQADYDALFEEYERRHLPKQTAALTSIRSWVRDGGRVALTCYEHLPQQCHRHCVGEALEQKFGSSFAPQHL
jgi:uncharacterized protein (DUF488 family)